MVNPEVEIIDEPSESEDSKPDADQGATEHARTATALVNPEIEVIDEDALRKQKRARLNEPSESEDGKPDADQDATEHASAPFVHPEGWNAQRHYGFCGQSCPCCRSQNAEDWLGTCSVCDAQSSSSSSD